MTPLDYVLRSRALLNNKDWHGALAVVREGLSLFPSEAQLQRHRLMCRLIIEGPERALASNNDQIDEQTGERLKQWLIARHRAGDVASYEDESWAQAILAIFDDTASWRD